MDLSHSFFSVFCVLNKYFLPHAALVAFRLGKFGEAFALVRYDAESIARTAVYDDESDYYTSAAWLSELEQEEPDEAVVGDQDVAGLQIVVNPSGSVQLTQAAHHAAANVQHSRRRKEATRRVAGDLPDPLVR